jgi:hypothetical protein
MKALTELLLNYKIPGVRESEIRKICAEEVFALTGCALIGSQVKYHNEKLTLSVPPVLKSALLVRQGELVERIKARDVAIRTIA